MHDLEITEKKKRKKKLLIIQQLTCISIPHLDVFPFIHIHSPQTQCPKWHMSEARQNVSLFISNWSECEPSSSPPTSLRPQNQLPSQVSWQVFLASLRNRPVSAPFSVSMLAPTLPLHCVSKPTILVTALQGHQSAANISSIQPSGGFCIFQPSAATRCGDSLETNSQPFSFLLWQGLFQTSAIRTP